MGGIAGVSDYFKLRKIEQQASFVFEDGDKYQHGDIEQYAADIEVYHFFYAQHIEHDKVGNMGKKAACHTYKIKELFVRLVKKTLIFGNEIPQKYSAFWGTHKCVTSLRRVNKLLIDSIIYIIH